MSDYWEDNLLEGSIGYVEVPITDRKVGMGRNWVRTQIPYRNGQGGEDTGRKAYTFNLTLPLYRGVKEEYYPDAYQRLIALLEDPDARGEVEYVDPEFGPLNVKIVDYDASTPSDKRNGVTLTVVLEELGFDSSLLDELRQPKLAGASRALFHAQTVDQEVAFLDVPEADKPGFSLTDTWRAFQASLDAGALAADEIAARLDEVYLVAEKFITFSAKDEIERWSLFNSVVMFAGAAEDFANDSAENQSGSSADLVETTLPVTMSAYDIASAYYGDAGRADEVIFNNPTAQPLAYPTGSTVRLSRDAKEPADRNRGQA